MDARSHAAWRVLESDIAIDTPHLRLRRDRIALPSGLELGAYYVRESRGFSVVFALTPDERVVLVRQYKHGIGRSVLELPAGGIDPGETAAACARRELAEETGYAGDPPELEHVGSYFFDPTNSTAQYHLFLARRAWPAGPKRSTKAKTSRSNLQASTRCGATSATARSTSASTSPRFIRSSTISAGSDKRPAARSARRASRADR